MKTYHSKPGLKNHLNQEATKLVMSWGVGIVNINARLYKKFTVMSIINS